MEFTILGIIWLFICLYGLIFWKIEKIISLLLLSCIFQCSPVIKLQGTNAIIPMLVASLFVILKSLIITVSSRSVIKFSKKQALPLLAFLAVIWLSFICTVIFSGIPVMEDTDFRTVANIKIIYYELSVSWGQVLKITKATVYILCYLCILDAVQKGLVHREAIEKTIIQAMWIVVAIGLIQYVSRLLGIRSVVLERLVYTDPVAEYYWKYTGRLYSTFYEASYCGAFLAASFWYCFVKNNKTLATLLLFELILNRSSTGLVAFLIGAIIWAISIGKVIDVLKYAVLFSVLLLLFSFTKQFHYVYDALFNKLSTGSYAERSSWNQQCLLAWLKTYGLGAGYGTIRGSSSFISIMGQIGTIGVIVWLWIAKSNIGNPLKLRGSDDAQKLMLLLVIVSQCVACPDVSFTVYWFALFANAASYRYSGTARNTLRLASDDLSL